MALDGNLKSTSFDITTTQSTRSAVRSKSLMPITGQIRVWYGEYTGTDAELLAEGMPIPAGKLLEHVQMYEGILTLRADSGTVKVHEVS